MEKKIINALIYSYVVYICVHIYILYMHVKIYYPFYMYIVYIW